MINIAVDGRVFSVEADWSKCADTTDFTSTEPHLMLGKYYIDGVEVTKEYFESEFSKYA